MSARIGTDSPAAFGPSVPARPGVYDATAGPADRTTFFDEQRRNRRRSWRFSLLAAVAVAITGLPSSVLLTPLLFVATLLVMHIANLISPLSPATWEQVRQTGTMLGRAIDVIDQGRALEHWRELAVGGAILVLPGAVFTFLSWVWLRIVLRDVRVGTALQRLGARELNARDPEEQQLGNLVAEMAIAAGVRPPRVLLVDTPAVNAAATGLVMDDATVLVTRGLLDRMNRDETQAIVGHVIASVGNGDLRILAIILSTFQTWGLLTLIMQVPFGPKSRSALWRLTKVAFRPRRREVDQWEAEFVADALLAGAESSDDDDLSTMTGKEQKGLLAGLRAALMFPVMLSMGIGSLTIRFALFISSTLLFGPLIAALWRTRRRLADAMAVQLTRNPDALARALRQTAHEEVEVPGGETVSYLFVVWSAGGSSRGSAAFTGGSMHPKIESRLRRLRAQGASEESTAFAKPHASTLTRVVMVVLFGLILGPPMALAAGLALVACAMMFMLSLAGMGLLLMLSWQLLNWGFGFFGR